MKAKASKAAVIEKVAEMEMQLGGEQDKQFIVLTEGTYMVCRGKCPL
jgi:hypothetical protein